MWLRRQLHAGEAGDEKTDGQEGMGMDDLDEQGLNHVQCGQLGLYDSISPGQSQ